MPLDWKMAMLNFGSSFWMCTLTHAWALWEDRLRKPKLKKRMPRCDQGEGTCHRSEEIVVPRCNRSEKCLFEKPEHRGGVFRRWQKMCERITDEKEKHIKKIGSCGNEVLEFWIHWIWRSWSPEVPPVGSSSREVSLYSCCGGLLRNSICFESMREAPPEPGKICVLKRVGEYVRLVARTASYGESPPVSFDSIYCTDCLITLIRENAEQRWEILR